MIFKAKPIPKAFLCHTAVLFIPNEERTDVFTQSFSEIPLENVRIERRTSVRLSRNNTVQNAAGVLYFDCTNSKPHGTVFTPSMRLGTDGGIFRIAEVQGVSDGAELHHYKVVFK